MKIKKMVGAVALTAALAMGSVPAFATTLDDEVGSLGDAFDDTGSGSTEITTRIDNTSTQVQARVPLSLVVVFNSNGYSEITAPTADAYGITCTGSDAIKLSKVEIADWNSDDFVSTTIVDNGDGTYSDFVDPDTLLEGSNIMFTLKIGSNFNWLTEDHGTSAWKATDKNSLPGAAKWTAPTIQPEDTLGIEIGGVSYFENPIDTDDLTDSSVCKIVYTITAA